MTHLLPLAPEPFTASTDRDMLPSERRAFVRTHRTCVFGYGRRHDGPAMSVVYYVPTDDDELLISTMAARSKARAIARNPKVSLCVLDERWPFSYLQVYADAVVDRDTDLVIDVMIAVGARMSGQPLGEEVRPVVAAMAAEEERVVLRCRPYATFASRRAICTKPTKPKASRIGCRPPFHGTQPTRRNERAVRRPDCRAEAPGVDREPAVGRGKADRFGLVAECVAVGIEPVEFHRGDDLLAVRGGAVSAACGRDRRCRWRRFAGARCDGGVAARPALCLCSGGDPQPFRLRCRCRSRRCRRCARRLCSRVGTSDRSRPCQRAGVPEQCVVGRVRKDRAVRGVSQRQTRDHRGADVAGAASVRVPNRSTFDSPHPTGRNGMAHKSCWCRTTPTARPSRGNR